MRHIGTGVWKTLAVLRCLVLLALGPELQAAVRFSVVGSPTEVINTGRSEVLGSVNFFVDGTGNVTGTSTGGATQIGLSYANPALPIDNTTGSGIKLFVSSGFAAASPTIVNVANLELSGRCSGLLTINFLPGTTVAAGEFIRVEGVRGRIDQSDGITPNSDLFVDLQSINDRTAVSFTPDRLRVAKSLDGLNVTVTTDGFGMKLLVSEGFDRAFVDRDSGNDGINANDRTDGGGGAIGAPTNSTQIVVKIERIPECISRINWPFITSTSGTGAALYLLNSSSSGSTANAIYSYESISQVGSSDLTLESFSFKPFFVFKSGSCDTSEITASVALGPAVSVATECQAPLDGAFRPGFLELFELALINISPASVVRGGDSFTLTLRGTGFMSSSVVQWNGTNRPTTLISGTRLTAAIQASDIGREGEATVTVRNPAFGGAVSNPLTFTILLPALQLYFPRLRTTTGSITGQDDSEFTGLALVNLGRRTAQLTLKAFDTSGVKIAGAGIINPATVNLNSGQQMALIDRQIWGSGLLLEKPVGWVRLEADVEQVAGFFLAFNSGLTVLDGADVSFATLSSFVLPEIDDLGFTQIHVANPGETAAGVTFELLSSDGTSKSVTAKTISPNGTLAESFSSLFSGVSPAATDYIRATSNVGVVPLEFFGRATQYGAALNGMDTTAATSILFSPQYVTGGSEWGSALTIINTDDVPGTLTLRFISDEGAQFGSTRILPISPRGKVRISDPNFFLDAGSTLTQGYVEVTSSGIRIVGDVVFGDPGRNVFSSALPLLSRLLSRLLFGQVASNNIYFTGVALLNPNDTDENAKIEVFDRSRTLLATKSELVPARRRRSMLLTQLFPELQNRDLSSGYITVTLSVGRGLLGFALFGTHNLSALSAVPAQAVP